MPLRLSRSIFVLPVLTASAALATPTFVGHIQFAESYGSLGGGEFRATPQSDFAFTPLSTGTPFQGGFAAGMPQFETFCLEKYENLDFTITNYSADLNTETVSTAPEYAGGNHGGFNDPLDARTTYLYDHFIHQTLVTPYSYTDEASRIDDANALQSAIWFIEEEDPTPLVGKALDLFNEANGAVNSGAWVGLGDVRVLNIYTAGPRVEFQDQLVLVPAPGVLALFGAGLLAMRRRRRPARSHKGSAAL